MEQPRLRPTLNLIFTGEVDWCVKDWAGWMTATGADSGKCTWQFKAPFPLIGGAIAGGVISYDTGAGQRVACAAGVTSPILPTPKIDGKVVVLGL